MNSVVVWTMGSFLGGRILERAVAAALGSASGRRLMQRWDKRELTPFEHRMLAQQWAGGNCQGLYCRRPHRGGGDELAEQR